MKRLLAFATAAALVGGASAAEAQDRIASRFDLGIYGGGSYTSSWFSFNDVDYGIGFQPIVGANATLWMSETFGLRANGSYIPSPFPHSSDDATISDSGR